MNYHCDGMRLQVVTILAVLQHLRKSVVDYEDSLGYFPETEQKPR
jgi:hypothetical protein